MAHFFERVKERIEERVHEGEERVEEALGIEENMQNQMSLQNRFGSFVSPTNGNRAKWYVDGCGYFWALSVAIEEARESIWILDWWLSPELYLRRPPSKNENYRLDKMLIAAAERGVKVNIIVYKEVAKVLTLCSEHTKHALEVHDNISVFRHPDHILDGKAISSELTTNMSHKRLGALPHEALKAVFGASDDVVLYWAHHEKLCLVDGRIAFMGGLDACFGRWDTNNHPIADAHPESIEDTVFPGQDYNNARVFDFQDVTNWDRNKLNRLESSRMGWSDLSVSLEGAIVADLQQHFVQRWNFIFGVKYDVRKKDRYAPLSLPLPAAEEHPIEEGYNEGGFRGAMEGGFHHPLGRHHPFMHHHLRRQHATVGDTNIQLTRSCSKWSHGVETEHSIANAYIQVIRESHHFVYIENQFFITATGKQQDPVRNQIGAAIVERIIRAARNGEDYKIIVCIPSVPAFAGDLHEKSSLGTRAIMEYQYASICRGGHSIMELIAKEGIDPKQYIRFYNLRNYDRINASASMSSIEKDAGVDYETARREHDDIVGAGYDGYGEQTGARYGSRDSEYERYQEAAGRYNDDGHNSDSVSDTYMLNGRPINSVPWTEGNVPEIDAYVSEELYIHSKLLIADDRIVICGSANLNDRSQLGDHDSEIAVVIADAEPLDSVMAGQQWQASRFAATLRRQLFRKHLGLLPAQDYRRPDDNFYPVDKCPNAYDFGSRADYAVQDPLSPDFDQLWTGTAATNTAAFSRAFHPVPADNVRNWDDYKSFFSDLFIVPSLDDDSDDDKDDGKDADGYGEEDGDADTPAWRQKMRERRDDRQQRRADRQQRRTDRKDVREDGRQPKYKYGHVVTEEFPGGVEELKEWLGQIRGTLVEMPLEFLADVDDIAKEGLDLNAFTEEIYT